MWPTIFSLKLPIWPHELTVRSYGLMLMIGFLGGTWWATRRAERTKADPELIVNMGFVALLSSIVGARAFYVIHYWDRFAGQGLWPVINITAGGLEFYGGFIAAFSTLLIYLWRKGVSLRLYLDLVAPSMAFGLAVTRVGCFLNGCCWGGPCPPQIPWAVHFPYGSPAFERQWHDRLAAIPAPLIGIRESGEAYPIDAQPDDKDKLRGVAIQAGRYGLTEKDLAAMSHQAREASLSLHPAQLYSSIDAGLLAVLLGVLFYRRKRHGVLAGLFLILYPIMRIFEEIVRVDNPHDSAGLTVSQFVSIPLLLIGITYLLIIYRLPLRSPKAVPFVPHWQQQAAKPQPRGKQAKRQRATR